MKKQYKEAVPQKIFQDMKNKQLQSATLARVKAKQVERLMEKNMQLLEDLEKSQNRAPKMSYSMGNHSQRPYFAVGFWFSNLMFFRGVRQPKIGRLGSSSSSQLRLEWIESAIWSRSTANRPTNRLFRTRSP